MVDFVFFSIMFNGLTLSSDLFSYHFLFDLLKLQKFERKCWSKEEQKLKTPKEIIIKQKYYAKGVLVLVYLLFFFSVKLEQVCTKETPNHITKKRRRENCDCTLMMDTRRHSEHTIYIEAAPTNNQMTENKKMVPNAKGIMESQITNNNNNNNINENILSDNYYKVKESDVVDHWDR